MLSNITMYAALPVKNMQEAMHFYGEVLGLTIIDENENGVWYQTGQSRIAVYESKFAGTNQATAVIFEVTEPLSMSKTLASKGIVFEKYDLPGVKRRGVIHTMGNFKAAWFKDPSGNIIAMGTHL